MKTRTLTLRRETLTDLTDDQLSGVVAAQPDMTPSCPLFIRLSELLGC